MTDIEAEALGKRLVACKGFRPLRGMLDMQGRTWDSSLLWRWHNDVDVPDLRDHATLGCLLALVREAFHSTDVFVLWSADRKTWIVKHGRALVEAQTEAEALVFALEAAP